MPKKKNANANATEVVIVHDDKMQCNAKKPEWSNNQKRIKIRRTKGYQSVTKKGSNYLSSLCASNNSSARLAFNCVFLCVSSVNVFAS